MLRSCNDFKVIQVPQNTSFGSGSEYLASRQFDFKSNMGLAETIFSRPINTAYLIRMSALQRIRVCKSGGGGGVFSTSPRKIYPNYLS